MNAQPDWGIVNANDAPIAQKAAARAGTPFPEDVERELVVHQAAVPGGQLVHAWRAGMIDIGTDAEGKVWVKMTTRQSVAFRRARDIIDRAGGTD